MTESWMGPVGLTLALLGAGGFVIGQIKMARVLARLDARLTVAADAKIGRLNRGAWVIGGAVFFYLQLRAFGHGRVGLLVCISVLLINAIVAAILRTRWLNELRPPREIAASHAFWAWQQATFLCAGFVGCAIYLIR